MKGLALISLRNWQLCYYLVCLWDIVIENVIRNVYSIIRIKRDINQFDKIFRNKELSLKNYHIK